MAYSYDWEYSYKGKIKTVVVCPCGQPAEYLCNGWMWDHDRTTADGNLMPKLINKYTCEQCKDNLRDEAESLSCTKVFRIDLDEFLFLSDLLRYSDNDGFELDELKKLENDFTDEQGLTEDKKNFYKIVFSWEADRIFKFEPVGCMIKTGGGHCINNGIISEVVGKVFKTKRIARNFAKKYGVKEYKLVPPPMDGCKITNLMDGE